MKWSIFTIILIFLTSCSQDKKADLENAKPLEKIVDTIIVKHQNDLNKSYEVGLYSKSYSYNWLLGIDTLDFVLHATEYEKDSTLHLYLHHKKPILFTTLLENINRCLPMIKNDFDIKKFSSIYFNSPIYYWDLTKELSDEYEQKFGRKNISYAKLNDFLLNSSLNTRLDNFLKPLDKKVKRYTIEKFHLMDKKYFGYYLPNIDLKNYPEFTIEGMGIAVQLENN